VARIIPDCLYEVTHLAWSALNSGQVLVTGQQP
jgi:hypothetical protein